MSPKDWRPADGITLEPNAWLATIEQERCVALTAGPGAGKTELLAQRADFLLRTNICRYPKRILAISFKVDASYNLKERIQRRCGVDLSSRFDSHTFHAFAKIISDRFRPILIGSNALNSDYKIGDEKILYKQITFKDLIPLAIQILKTSPIARNAIRQTYSDVFLDEFQDCTDGQYQLLKIVFQGTGIRLTAVGDIKQRIMGWAGALEGIFATFATDFSALILNMYRNFRSQPRLLRMQNEIIKVLDPSSFMSDNHLMGNEGEIYSLHFDSSQEETKYLANLISNWISNEYIPLAEIAILVSKQPDLYLKNFMEELNQRGIPFRNEQELQDLSKEPVVQLIIDYLLVILGDREPAAWLRLVRHLANFVEDNMRITMADDWQYFIKYQRKEMTKYKSDKNSSIDYWLFVKKFLTKIGMSSLTALSPAYESGERLREIIRETKSHINKLLKIEPELSKVLAKFSDNQTIRILTIHKSKGLEFSSVIIIGVENETFWGKPEEERCAFFVGVSRAKQRLVMTVCNQRDRPPASQKWQERRTPHKEFLSYAEPFLFATPDTDFY
jgi:superfamily I DNA/RNA helicase